MRIAINLLLIAFIMLCGLLILSEVGVIFAKLAIARSPLGDVLRIFAGLMVLITLLRALVSKSRPPG
jgi:hypothetical protein